MSACPANLGLSVLDASGRDTDGQRSSVLLTTDLLVFCPSNFTVNVRFRAPDVDSLSSIVVRFADSGRSPFDLRLSHISTGTINDWADQQTYAGYRRSSTAAPKPLPSQADNRPADFKVEGNILIAIAISGALFIVVYVGQNTARATIRISGTLLPLC